VHIFNRRFEKEAGAQASAIICLYMLVVFACAMIICGVEGNKTGFDGAVFEVISAVGTVGLTTGITSQLHVVSKIVLILLMFFGRIGGFTLVLVFSGENKPVTMGRAAEHIIVG
ncbi:MAG: Trk family potassium uptake protein, partial [Clostridia bacterium]|nr:Trk family potassium uptake protein [Clostridia bacterium]